MNAEPWPTYTHATKYGPLTVTVYAGPIRAPDPRKYTDTPQLEPIEPAYLAARIRPPRTPLDQWPHDHIDPLRINGVEYDLDATVRRADDGTWSIDRANGGWPRPRRIRADGFPSVDPTDAAYRITRAIVDAIAAELPAHTAEARAAEIAAADMRRASAREMAAQHRAVAALYDALAEPEPTP